MRTGTRRQLVIYGFWVAGAALAGALVGAAVGAAYLHPKLYGALAVALGAALQAAAVMALIGWVEILFPRTRLGRAFDRAPFLVAVGGKGVAYILVILLVVWAKPGEHVVRGFLIASGLAETLRMRGEVTVPHEVIAAYSLFIIWLIVLLLQVSRLVGERTLLAIALGRYHRSRAEERFFLFIDIVGSTPLAERLGPASVHKFLDRVFEIASDPIDDHRGEIYQYVRDEMVITWTLAEGRAGARPIACFFAVERALEQAVGEFQRDFDAVPGLRAALHAGAVISGEVGGSRRSIVFHGDVMNTTSRIESATRELGRAFLVSEDALSRVESTVGYAVEDLGLQALRGRATPVRLYAAKAMEIQA